MREFQFGNGVKKQWKQISYLPPILASDPTPDCIGFFESIFEQQLSRFHGITIKTTLQAKKE